MPCRKILPQHTEKLQSFRKVQQVAWQIHTMLQMFTYQGTITSVVGCYVLISYVNSSHFNLRQVIQGIHYCLGKCHSHLRTVSTQLKIRVCGNPFLCTFTGIDSSLLNLLLTTDVIQYEKKIMIFTTNHLQSSGIHIYISYHIL